MKIFSVLAVVILLVATTSCANNGHKKYKKKHSCSIETVEPCQSLSDANHSA